MYIVLLRTIFRVVGAYTTGLLIIERFGVFCRRAKNCKNICFKIKNRYCNAAHYILGYWSIVPENVF